MSKKFHRCLLAILRSHNLLKKPMPITEDYEDSRWKCFVLMQLLCLLMSKRYRSTKRTLAMNVLGACIPNMKFTYVLSGWEGSAHHDRVLRESCSSRCIF